ncbi:hypothetical protein KOI35_40740 [Actinoplanes bogorensis]|uniref:Helicase C-terminal domain-containing protein n=1 Tax=Paractinoplanes bogorensis TaxID=1610840 RepID=A0ABS5Z2H7_9ACTN|nr:hypothetical protein [Actinoplanes bogorensis]MBU2669857.1 hypothetical protein [Actinoplanes bogorensis]
MGLVFIHDTEFRRDLPPAALNRALVADEARNAQIVGDVVAALDRGRNCLVLTRWVAHVAILVSLLAARGRSALPLRGGMSSVDRGSAAERLARVAAGDGVLVVGTMTFAGPGAPGLDTLFLAAPISYDGLLVQCAGRVLRAAGVAEVHDYHDREVPILDAALRSRRPGYRALGFDFAEPS